MVRVYHSADNSFLCQQLWLRFSMSSPNIECVQCLDRIWNADNTNAHSSTKKRKRNADDTNADSSKKVRGDSIRYKLVKKTSTSTSGILSFFDFICQVGKERLLEKLQDREQKLLLLEQLTVDQLLLMDTILSELRCDVVRECNEAIAIREGKIRKESVKGKTWAKKVLSDNSELIMSIFIEFLKLENYC